MTQFLIISSTKDKASRNIKDKLLSSKIGVFELARPRWHNNHLFKLDNNGVEDPEKRKILDEIEVFLGVTNERLIFLNDLKLNKSEIKPDIVIFASRHSSKTGRPSFLVHTTGNWTGDIRYGGEGKKLSHASALLLKAGYNSIIKKVNKYSMNGFSIDIEVTHHGPALDIPLLFMELGSKPSEWHHNKAGVVLGDAIIETIFKYKQYEKENSQKIGVGFGGTHYAPQFQRLINDNNIAVSFICPKYFIRSLNEDLIEQILNNNLEKIDYFILDWSGLNSADKDHLLPLLEKYKIPIKKIKDF
ncbi:MAG: hypothetical protein GF317_03960 [Candidatus Lokiarchaeota archaeon]|nr:hypothetical protein [Candidatus Lokiarchaeota archaeon]MBD3199041.1 hypothetical protein [Candidatus Lokiarchaeota archaeon]